MNNPFSIDVIDRAAQPSAQSSVSHRAHRAPSMNFMDEYEYNRAHITENPGAFEDSIRTILAALA